MKSERFSWEIHPSGYLIHTFKEELTDVQVRVSGPVGVGVYARRVRGRLRGMLPPFCVIQAGRGLSSLWIKFPGTPLPSKPTTSRRYFRIESNPLVCSGAPKIKGTRIRVADIVKLYRAGYMIKDIAEWFSITVEDVQEALNYYNEHKDEVDRLIEEEERELERLLEMYGEQRS